MKLSISNIAWNNREFPNFLKFIKELGCSGIELAPSCIWKEPIDSAKEERELIYKLISMSGLKIVSFHALLYTRPDLKIFLNNKSRKQTINYLKKLFKLCYDLKGKKLVFGSPNNRKLHGRKYIDCFNQSIEDFYDLGQTGKKYNIKFCIEPLAPNETEFLYSYSESINLIKKINHPFVKLNLDTKSLFSTKENISNIINSNKDILEHVHISSSNLQEIGLNNRKEHIIVAKMLKKIGYSKYISIEMKKNNKNISASIKRSIEYVKKNYFK